MPLRTPPPTSLSDPPSPTELPVSNIDLNDEESDMLSQASKRITKTITTTVTPIFMRSKPVYVIVATSVNPPMGIGHEGKLPWQSIKADMAFFKDVTSYVSGTEATQSAKSMVLNAVLMGRKTWESIPAKFRPLSGRLNVIITRGSTKQLGVKILEELKAKGAAVSDWVIHELPAVKSKSNTKLKASEAGPIVILVPRSASTSSRQSLSPVVISSSVSSTLALLSSSEPIAPALSISTPTSDPESSSSALSAPSISVNKIFCIGGAEIYRQILATSNHQPQSPTVANSGTDSGTGTDTEGEASEHTGRGKGARDYFEVRILQTQIRKYPRTSTSESSQERKKTDEPDFECDTFFPDLLPSPGSNVKSTKWRSVDQDVVSGWIGDVLIPQHQGRRKESIQQETIGEVENEEDADGKELWLQDAKAGVELRVVGWQRR
jgi:dihydrofolate reductase